MKTDSMLSETHVAKAVVFEHPKFHYQVSTIDPWYSPTTYPESFVNSPVQFLVPKKGSVLWRRLVRAAAAKVGNNHSLRCGS